MNGWILEKERGERELTGSFRVEAIDTDVTSEIQTEYRNLGQRKRS